jgi:DNA-binding transcriptional ArsR family regulator
MTYTSALTALSDPTRRAVFERLRAGPASVQQIADGLPVSRPAVSQHLKALREAGLVRDEPRGTARIYSIHTPGLRALRDWIDGFWDEALDNFKSHAEKKK